MNARAVVESFVEAWNRMDFDAIIDSLDENVFYHNIPMEPVKGREAVRAYLRGAWRFESVDWQMINIVSDGNIVLTERIDDFVINGHKVSLPVMGVFEVVGSKITVWRDYFDLAGYKAQLQAAAEGAKE